MKNESTQTIANQTEIPVENLPFKERLNSIPVKKLLIALIILVIIILAIVGSFIYLRDLQAKKILTITQEAESAYKAGDYKKAKEKLDEALVLKKDDPEILAAAAKTIALQGNHSGQEQKSFEVAKSYLDKALSADPKNLEVLLSAGYLYETSGDYNKALEYYSQATKLYQNSSDAWFHYGHVLQFLGKKEEAVKAYDESLKLNANNPLSLMAKANILATQGKLEDSYLMFKKASEVSGISSSLQAEALTGASIVRTSQILYMKEATELAKRSVEADPSFSPALAAYGFVLSINGNPKDGIEYLKKAIEANPRISKNYNQLAQVYRSNKLFIDAINYQKEAMARVDDDNTLLGPQEKKFAKARYIYDLAKTYDMAGLKVDIVPLLSQAVQINPLIKGVIKNDFEKYGFFKNLSNDQRFNQLIL